MKAKQQLEEEEIKLETYTNLEFKPTLAQEPELERLHNLAMDESPMGEKYREALITDITKEIIRKVKEETEQGRSLIMELYGSTRGGKSLVAISLLDSHFQSPLELRRIVRLLEEQEKLLQDLKQECGEGKRVGWIMVDEQRKEHGDNRNINIDEQRNREEILAEDMVNFMYVSATLRTHPASIFVIEPIRGTWGYNVPDRAIIFEQGLTAYEERAKAICTSRGLTECFVWQKAGEDLVPYGCMYVSPPKNIELIREYLKQKREFNLSLISGDAKPRWKSVLDDYIFANMEIMESYIRKTATVRGKNIAVKQKVFIGALKDDREASKHMTNTDYVNCATTFDSRVRDMFYRGELNIKRIYSRD